MIVVWGGVVSGGGWMVQPKLAALASTLPDGSIARTANVWVPTERAV